MSERMFFTLRYALPGYIFLLAVVSMNWTILCSLFFSEELGAMFTALFVFLYLLSGSAIGFLVSQLWYTFFNYRLFGKYGVLPEVTKILRDRYKKSLKKEIDVHKLHLYSDYIQRLHVDKEMLMYAERRWDLIHLFGSTIFSLPIGLLIGFYFYYVIAGIQPNELVQIIASNISYISPLALLIIILYVCMLFGLKRALKESSIARLMLIKEVLHKHKEKKLPIELNDIFPECFETQADSNNR